MTQHRLTKWLARVRRPSEAAEVRRLDMPPNSTSSQHTHRHASLNNASLENCSRVPVELTQHRHLLLTKGMRLHEGFVERADCCSLAVLDPRGMVVAWYDAAFGGARTGDGVLDRHVSQFYLPSDIAAGVPLQDMRSAAAGGLNTQHGWRRRPTGAIFWGTTVIDTVVSIDGSVIGYAHVTRRSNGPWEALHTAAVRPQRRRRLRTQWRWSVNGASAPAYASAS